MKFSDKAIMKYGRDVTVFNSSGEKIQHTKCIIQPLRYKNKMYTQGTPTDIGLAQAGYYLLIAPSSLDACNIGENGYISDNEKLYHLDRSENVYLGNSIMYIWAILREKNQGDYPVYDHFV